MMDALSWLAAILGGVAAGVAIGALIVGPYLGKRRWYGMSAEELQAQIAKHGLRYDFTVASTQSLLAHLESREVRVRFMDRLLERVRTKPMTNLQYQMLAEVASVADQDYWSYLRESRTSDS